MKMKIWDSSYKFIAIMLLVTLTLLNYADYEMTKNLMLIDGYGVEKNPLIYHIVVFFDSPKAILWVKTIILSMLWIAVFLIRDHHRINDKRYARILAMVNIPFAALFAYNMYNLGTYE